MSLATWAAQLERSGNDGVAARACRLAASRTPPTAAWLAVQPELLATIALLGELGVGEEAQAACLLHALMLADPAVDVAALAGFPDGTRALVEGQQAAERVWALYAAHGTVGGSEGLRRLLLAIIRDLRVVFILLARQLVRMRGATRAPEAEQRALARLSADIHAPLANRLGIWQIKWELEDLAFRFLQPDVYRRIAGLLDERRGDREAWIGDAKTRLGDALRSAGIDAEIAGRPKHIYSIWRKMQRKGVEFSELYDVRALRLLVTDVAACYAALGVVHTLWPYIPGEFDDYIANPKGNHYQSLHTAVIGPGGRTLEVQIRSHDMHRHAELGVAAHWRYKEGGGADASFERKIAWMRQLLEARDASDDDAALLAGFRTEVVEDRVYLLTPKGQVIDLPRGATVLDFAYSIHTDVGHRCRGAKVNGRIVPLPFQPSSGDRIEILTGKTIEPKRDWLAPQHGYLNTHRAREKVRAWFKRVDLAQNLAAGRTLLERELKRLALQPPNLDDLPERFHVRTHDELLEALALGDVSTGQLARALHELSAPPPEPVPVQAPHPAQRPVADSGAIVIEGIGNLLNQLARCCQPLPGDAIAGYITRGRGVSVHRADCAQLAKLRERDASRVIAVEWGRRREASYEVDVIVKGYDRKWLHKDVTNVIAAANAHVIAVDARVDERRGTVEMNYALKVSGFDQLSALLSQLLAIPNVIEARRIA
ncbi:GTP pyrophosphokinase [Dokdonella fugitiva]|uniref:GTP pyrophosphokinase n=1 Tax=Dokdonella fugitiva TaxID=328517 RepID=A0A839F8J2_9GAMM|nr:bifunctional (p)ppGpp synthetase/guanosine-3',5'-bis(diphosphate) 3'-pyrophosphohydrolase [Dokdonella fugitiva]MBA8889868.1 GTP pyrophosphokinase [Dokdonella fugitiva]